MSWLDSVIRLPASVEDIHHGQQLLDEIRALSSLNAILFDHLRAALVPRGVANALPRNTHVQAGKQAQSDGRVLELYMGILFHCMGYTVLSCGGGPADGGVDVKVEDSQGNIVVIQCKQYARAVVGYNMGLQLVGAMYTTRATLGVLITPSTASKDVKMLARSMQDIRHGELRLHVWEGEHLIRLLGRWSADIMDTRAAMLDDVLDDVDLCNRIIASQPNGYCIRHAMCLPRRAGECDMHCSPASNNMPERLSTKLRGEVPTVLSASSVQTASRPSTCSSPVITSLLVVSADQVDYNDEALESISSDEEGEEEGHGHIAVTRHPSTDVQLSTASGAAHFRRTAQPTCAPASCPPLGGPYIDMTKLSADAITPSRSRPAVLWTEEEERELQRCVMQLGVGKWTDILDSSALLRAQGKTATKIRDKWKNMQKRQLRPCIDV